MDIPASEDLFATYLAERQLTFQRHYVVGKGDVDFKVESAGHIVYCDVKEVRDSQSDPGGRIDAGNHIRSDIRKLRAKFGKTRPQNPLVLVTMNFSSTFFTAFTVASALLGKIGLVFDRSTGEVTSQIHHLPRGNAVLTQRQNRSVSAVLIYDCGGTNHCLLHSPFADRPVPQGFFPDVQSIYLDRNAKDSSIIALSGRHFWGF